MLRRIVEFRVMTEKQVCLIMKQVLLAVDYCHRLKIIHRDLKPENIVFLSKKKLSGLKVIDFGRSTVLEPTQNTTERAGTVIFHLILIF